MTNKQLIAKLKKLPPEAEVLYAVPAMKLEQRDVPGFKTPLVRWQETAAALPVEVTQAITIEGAGTFVVLAERIET